MLVPEFAFQPPIIDVSANFGFSQSSTDPVAQAVDVGSAGDPGGAGDGSVSVEPETEPGLGGIGKSSQDGDSVDSTEVGKRLPFFFTSPR
jgi:hypothetical protein